MENQAYTDSVALRKLWIKEARGGISRIFISLFVFQIISFGVVNLTAIALAIISPRLYLELAENAVFNILLSSGAMYCLAFPVFYLMVRKMKVRLPQKTKLEAGELITALFIAETLMIAGSYASMSLTALIEGIIGQPIPDNTSELILDTPIWLLILIVVIIGPIVEELIFRKLMIDRLSPHGELYAVIVSSVAFGIFHQNIYQLFYATLLGFLLGYLYLKSGDIKISIFVHMIINLLGSVVALFIQEKVALLSELSDNAAYAEEIPYDVAFKLYDAVCAVLSYEALVYGMALAGFVMLIIGFRRKKYRLSKDCPLPLDARGLTEATLVNVGAILFLALSAIMTFMNMILPLLVV